MCYLRFEISQLKFKFGSEKIQTDIPEHLQSAFHRDEQVHRSYKGATKDMTNEKIKSLGLPNNLEDRSPKIILFKQINRKLAECSSIFLKI